MSKFEDDFQCFAPNVYESWKKYISELVENKDEDYWRICEIEIAKGLVMDFKEESCRKIANIILSTVEE